MSPELLPNAVRAALTRDEHSIARMILEANPADAVLWISAGSESANCLVANSVNRIEVEEKARSLARILTEKWSLRDVPADIEVDLDEAAEGGEPGFASERLTPVLKNGECLGGFLALSRGAASWNERILESAALAFDVAFSIGRQQRSMDNTTKRLSEIAEVGAIFADAGDFDRNLNRILDLGVRVSGAEVGGVIHYDRRGNIFFTGIPREVLTRIRFRGDQTLMDKIVQVEVEEFFPGKAIEELLEPDPIGMVIKSLVILPLFFEKRRYGGMVLLNAPERYFEEKTYAAILSFLGRIAAAAITSEERQQDAFYDILTGLPNRRLFLDRLAHAITRAKKSPDFSFAVLILGIDRFKIVNDSLGHEAGDSILSELSQRLMDCVGPGDTFARLGGDQFTVLLEGLRNPGDPKRIADKIHEELSRPFVLGMEELYVSVSIGIVLKTTVYDKPDDLLRDAEAAMNRAKSLGKGQSAVFEDRMHQRAVSILKLEADLKRAIDRGEIVNYYQPIVSGATGQVVGFETLVRWLHPERGLVSPGEFIPVAEETGLIAEIGEKALLTASRQVRAWRDAGFSVEVAVNVSPQQLERGNLVEVVKRVLGETGAAPESVKLEITESMAMSDVEKAIVILQELHDMGVRLSLDDFGTGHSSLSVLSRLPLNYLKVDQSFVRNIPANKDHMAITKSIIAMAHGLEMLVIAEGVEKEEQLAFLREHQCDQIQGWYYSPAVPCDKAEEFMRKNLESVSRS